MSSFYGWSLRHVGSATLLAGLGFAPAAMALTITPTFDANVTGSVYATQIEAAFAVAAAAYTSRISTAVDIAISVDWSAQSYLGSSADSLIGFFTYGQVRSALLGNPSSHAAALTLPVSSPAGPSLYAVPSAEFKALGGVTAAGFDSFLTFSSSYSWTFDPTAGVPAGTYDFLSVAEHEINHALGRIAGVFNSSNQANLPDFRTPLDLYRYTAPGVIATTDTNPDYLSLDAGRTALQTFSTVGDTADVTNIADATTAFTFAGTAPVLLEANFQALQALGFSLDSAPAPVPEPAALALFAGGLAGLQLLRRRRPSVDLTGNWSL